MEISLKPARLLSTILFSLILILFISIILLSSTPPISKDALAHHLAVPKLYLKYGGIYEIPSLFFSYYPMNLDLLYLIPLYFGNDIVPKFIHFSFALLTAWLIFDYLRRRLSITYALTGALFFLSIPIIVKLSITVYVDLGLIFFSTASLLLLLKWIESHFRLRFLIISAIFCGLAMGTKYNGLVTFFLLTLFVPFLYSRYKQGGRPGFFRPAGYGILFLFIALLVFSPWMIRNYYWKNNPIYPLYNKWFNPPKGLSRIVIPRDAVKKSYIGLFGYRNIIYHETWWQIALLPVRIFFQGKDGSSQYFDGKLSPFLLFLPIFAFYRIREGPQDLMNEKKIMLAFSVLFFAFGFFSSVLRIRYISPIIPPLVILSVFGVKNIIGIVQEFRTHTTRQTGLALFFVTLAFFLILNAYYVIGQFRYVGPLNYLSGALSRDEYISKYRFEYPAMQYINKNLSPDARILFIFLGKRGYYCDRKYVFDMNNRKSTLRQLVKKTNTPEKILLGLKGMGMTHLLINYDIFEKWVKTQFTPEDKEILNSFFKKYVKLLFFKKGYGVSRLENFDETVWQDKVWQDKVLT